MSGAANQAMSYAADPSSIYMLTRSGDLRNAISGALGLRAATPTGLSGSLEYMATTGDGRLQGHGLRGMLQFPFTTR